MGWRLALVVVVSLLVMPWAGTIPSSASQGHGGNARSSGIETLSVQLDKEVWSSAETFSASVVASNLTIGHTYTMQWEVRSGNGTFGHDVLVRNGQLNISATNSAMEVQVQANHLNSSTSYLHRLLMELSDTSGLLTAVQANFSSFTNSLPSSYSDIIIFGDSLSDMGNSYSQWGTPDSPPYWNGRFSNGDVWSSQFGQFMGNTMSPGRGSASGNNRAYGGAHSGSGTYLLVIPNVGKQVDDYLQNRQINANELVIIWCGGNDFVHSSEQDTQQIVDDIDSHITKLTSAGATEFLVLELPPLDTVPRVNEENDEAGVIAMHERILDFNTKLHSMLNDTVSTTSLTIHRGMSWQMFDTVYNNPSYFGLTNVTHPACDHDGYTCENGDTIAANAEEYIYFDKMHPTMTMHDLVDLYIRQVMGVADVDGDAVADDSDECLDTLPDVPVTANGCDVPPPDMDGDGVLNEDDYCPDTPANESVNADGCSESQLDDDEDGLTNDLDQCPDTPAGEEVDVYGCGWSQMDDDGDGVLNGQDQCPSTDMSFSVDLNGCAPYQKDDDEDNVTNDLDLCPGSWAGSLVDVNGCALYQKDTDDDGVKDHKDECSQTPFGDTVDAVGCGTTQKDDDEDGIMNAYDECSTTPPGESVNAVGCALVELDTDHDGFSDAVDDCPETSYGENTDDSGCADEQIDTDEDGFNNRDDLCTLTAGESGGCPTLTLSVIAPGYGSQHYRGDDITFQVLIQCSSNCSMILTQVARVGNFSAPVITNANNGTYEWTMLVPSDSQYMRIDMDLTLSSGEISESMTHIVMLRDPPIVDDNVSADTSSTDLGDDKSASGGLIDSNFVAVSLLITILAILVALYRQQPPAKPLLSEEEKWIEQTSLVASASIGSEVFGDGRNLS
jgi:phospholipase/lecithinase/hemolysin